MKWETTILKASSTMFSGLLGSLACLAMVSFLSRPSEEASLRFLGAILLGPVDQWECLLSSLAWGCALVVSLSMGFLVMFLSRFFIWDCVLAHRRPKKNGRQGKSSALPNYLSSGPRGRGESGK